MENGNDALKEIAEVLGKLSARHERLNEQKAAMDEEMAFLQSRIGALTEALSVLRERRGMQRKDDGGGRELRERLSGLAPKDMVLEYAKMHEGRIVVKDAAKELAEAGLFASVKNASSNIYTAIDRSGRFRKVRRGIHELSSTIQSPASHVNLEPFLEKLSRAS